MHKVRAGEDNCPVLLQKIKKLERYKTSFWETYLHAPVFSYGHYSNATRGRLKKEGDKSETHIIGDESPVGLSRFWAWLIQKIYDAVIHNFLYALLIKLTTYIDKSQKIYFYIINTL